MSLSSIVARIRAFFTPAPVAPAPVAPVPAKPTWYYRVTRTRGSQVRFVAEGRIEAASPAAALSLIALNGLAHPGEAVEIDGKRWRMWAAARPTPIDPAHRAAPGDRRRDRERGMNG